MLADGYPCGRRDSQQFRIPPESGVAKRRAQLPPDTRIHRLPTALWVASVDTENCVGELTVSTAEHAAISSPVLSLGLLLRLAVADCERGAAATDLFSEVGSGLTAGTPVGVEKQQAVERGGETVERTGKRRSPSAIGQATVRQ